MTVGVVQVKDTIISHGCFLRECKVENSIVGIRSRIESGCDIKVYCLSLYLHLLGAVSSDKHYLNLISNVQLFTQILLMLTTQWANFRCNIIVNLVFFGHVLNTLRKCCAACHAFGC